MKKFLIAAFYACMTASGAYAASTIDPTIPASNSPLASAPIRNNFLAAQTDVNNLLTKFASSLAPFQPSTFQEWMQVGSTPYVWQMFDGTQWVTIGTLNATTHSMGLNLNLPLTYPLSVNLNAGALTAAQTGTLVQGQQADGVVARVELDAFGSTAAFSGVTTGGTLAAPTAVTSGSRLTDFNAFAYDGASKSIITSMRTYAAESQGPSNHGSKICWSTTPLASITMADGICQQPSSGITVGSPTGGDKGAGTINAASAIYVNNVAALVGSVSLTGDVSGSGTNSIATTLATVNPNVGSFGSATQESVFTVNAKGLITAASQVLITPAFSSLTGTTNMVTNSILAQAPANTFKCNPTGSTANEQDCTVISANIFPALTGDVTTSAGSLATTITNNAVTNAKSAQMTANTIKGNFTGSTANAADNAIPSCSSVSSALNYTSGAGLGCNTSINAAQLQSGTWAAPGAIGSTTPAAGTFTSLTASSFSFSGQFIAQNGTQSAPGYSFAGSNSTGVYFNVGTATLNWSVGNNTMMTLSTSEQDFNAATIKYPNVPLDTALVDRSLCLASATLKAGSGTNGTCLGTSSKRYKRDWHALNSGLWSTLLLRPVSFYYKKGYGDDGKNIKYGFLAEDMATEIPDLAGKDAKGLPNTVDMLGVVPVLARAVQEITLWNLFLTIWCALLTINILRKRK